MLGQFAVMLSFAWLFADRYGPSTYLRHLFVGVCILTVSLLVTALLAPDVVIDFVVTNQGTEVRFRGERIAGTGAIAAMGLVFCLSNVPRLRAAPFWGAVALFGVLLATSRMRTTYAALLAYLPIGYAFGRGLRVRWLVPLLLVILVGAMTLDALAPATDFIVRESQSIESISDRIPLWSHLTAAVLREEPLIGLGYFAASRVLGPQYNPGLGNAHSVFFELLVGGGLLGAGLYLILCWSHVRYGALLLRTAGAQPDEVVTAVGLLAVTLVLGLTSSEAAHAGPVGFVFWSMTALLPAMHRSAALETAARPGRFGIQRTLSPARTASATHPVYRGQP
jgi:hypothetical protein